MSINILTPLPLYIFFMVCAVTVFLYALIRVFGMVQDLLSRRLRRRRKRGRWAL